MRMVPACLGVATVPLAYLTLRALDCRATTALLASLFITFENGMVTQSRHILLDSPLIFFTALTIFLWTCFSIEDKHEPFTESWWAWLILTGLSLGAVLSCKWVGLFTVALARAVGPSGQVLAVEADAEASRHARANLTASGNVVVVTARVDDTFGVARPARRGSSAARAWPRRSRPSLGRRRHGRGSTPRT